MYEFWYLDTIKMLNICSIYGDTNPSIVIKLIANVYQALPQEYEDDFRTVVKLVQNRLEINCDGMAGEQNFYNFLMIEREEQRFEKPIETIHFIMIEIPFTFLDILFNIEAILTYFPSRQKLILMENALIFKRILMSHNKLRENAEKSWNFGPYQSKFKKVVELVRYKTALVLSKALKELHLETHI